MMFSSNNGNPIYYDSTINIFFILNDDGEEILCNERGVVE